MRNCGVESESVCVCGWTDLTVAHHPDEVGLRGHDDVELSLVSPLPAVVCGDGEGQGVIITNVDLLLVTATGQRHSIV